MPIFQCLYIKAPKVCEISMEGKNLSVPMPILRTGTSPKGIYKVNESPNSFVKETKCSSDHFSRRLPVASSNSPGGRDSEGHTNFHSATPRVFDQFQKVNFGTNPFDTVSWSRSKFNRHETESSKRQDNKNCFTMSKSTGSTTSDNSRPYEISGSTILLSH